HRQCVLGRDIASSPAVTGGSHTKARGARRKALVRSGAERPARLDDPAASAGRRGVSREGQCIPPGDGRAWPLRQAVPGLWHGGAENPLCRERNQLLPALPDRWPRARGPLPVTVVEGRLAANDRGVGGGQGVGKLCTGGLAFLPRRLNLSRSSTSAQGQ